MKSKDFPSDSLVYTEVSDSFFAIWDTHLKKTVIYGGLYIHYIGDFRRIYTIPYIHYIGPF